MSLASIDGTIVPVDEARIPVTDDGLIRGDGVFEVVRLYDGRPFAWEDHLRRLSNSAAGLRLEIDLQGVRAEAEALVRAGGEENANGTVRIMLTRAGRRIGILEPLDPFRPALRLGSVTFAPPRILDGIKSLSYAGNMLASRLAREQGADEAVLVTPHGRVLEAPTASVFWVREGTLHTPPLEDHILDSITRRRIMRAMGAREMPTTLDDLFAAEEAFLASTTREVQAVCAVDGRELDGAPGPRTREAAEVFREIVEDELANAGARG